MTTKHDRPEGKQGGHGSPPDAGPLPRCRYRGPQRGDGRYPCSSANIVAKSCGVPAATCLRCPYADRTPLPVLSAKKNNGRPPYLDCPHHGETARDDAGRAQTKWCGSCNQNLVLFDCTHHAVNRRVTVLDCRECPHQPGGVPRGP